MATAPSIPGSGIGSGSITGRGGRRKATYSAAAQVMAGICVGVAMNVPSMSSGSGGGVGGSGSESIRGERTHTATLDATLDVDAIVLKEESGSSYICHPCPKVEMPQTSEG